MLEDPTFWVLVSFVIFIAAVAKPIGRAITTPLDQRSEKIHDDIQEAERLREEAQELLAKYERKQRDSAGEAEHIAEQARAEAERLKAGALKDLEESLDRREKLALERIEQAETAAVDQVRAIAVEAAVDAARRILAEKISGPRATAMVDAAIKELPEKLH